MKSVKPFALGLIMTAMLPTLTACMTLAVGAVAVTTVEVATDRRTVGRNIDDNTLELKLRTDLRLDESLGSGVNISVTSMNGVVLLTGETYSDSQRQRAESIAKSYEETRQVVNEIELAGKTNMPSRANDSWITSKVKTELVKSKDVSAQDVKVVTERGKVYLMGLVTRAEADAAVKVAQGVSGVTQIFKVFEYIK